MVALPVAERELRTASRRRGTWRLRFWSTLVALVVSQFLWMTFERGFAAPFRGTALFIGLSFLIFAFVLFIGPLATAGCVSNERRDGTLGLLFLTDLKGYDVVLGKLVARALNCVYGLVAILPVLAIPMLMGGVTPRQFRMVCVVLFNTLFVGLAIGLAISSLSIDERRAFCAALLLVILLSFGPWMTGMALFMARGVVPYSEGSAVLQFFSAISPLAGLLHALSGTGMMPVAMFATPAMPIATLAFWQSQTVLHLLGWLLLVMAMVVVPRFRERAERPSRGKRVAAPNDRSAVRRPVPHPLLDRRPYQWLAMRDRSTTAKLFFFISAISLLFASLAIVEPFILSEFAFLKSTAAALHFFLKVWIAIEACARIYHDHRTGAFELLLTVPMGDRLALDHVTALIRQFAAPVALLIALEHLAFRMSGFRTFDEPFNELVLSQILLVVNLLAIACVGCWRALKASSLNRAVLQTLALVLVVPWLVRLPWSVYLEWIAPLLPFYITDPIQSGGLFGKAVRHLLWNALLIGLFARRVITDEWRSAAAMGGNTSAS